MYVYIHNNTSSTYIINIFIYLYLLEFEKELGMLKAKRANNLHVLINNFLVKMLLSRP